MLAMAHQHGSRETRSEQWHLLKELSNDRSRTIQWMRRVRFACVAFFVTWPLQTLTIYGLSSETRDLSIQLFDSYILKLLNKSPVPTLNIEMTLYCATASMVIASKVMERQPLSYVSLKHHPTIEADAFPSLELLPALPSRRAPPVRVSLLVRGRLWDLPPHHPHLVRPPLHPVMAQTHRLPLPIQRYGNSNRKNLWSTRESSVRLFDHSHGRRIASFL